MEQPEFPDNQRIPTSRAVETPHCSGLDGNVNVPKIEKKIRPLSHAGEARSPEWSHGRYSARLARCADFLMTWIECLKVLDSRLWNASIRGLRLRYSLLILMFSSGMESL